MVIGSIAGANIHIGMPPVASDSYVYDVATKLKNNFPAGRKVYVELSDEPWNFGQGLYYYLRFMKNLNSYSDLFAWYVIRVGQIRALFRQAFGSRANEIHVMINNQWSSPNNGYDMLNLAISYGVTIDAYAVAPYLDPDTGAASVAAWNNSATIAQMCDLWIHDQYYKTYGTIPVFSGSPTHSPGTCHLANIAAYNTATGGNCYLIGYEGGFETGTPGNNQTTLGRDMTYHPNWRIIEQDFYALLQLSGYMDIAINDWCGPLSPPSDYAYYHSPHQLFGKGDGSDGKADNRLWFCTPGFIINYAPTITNTQDLNTVSVRGQAFLDWMQPTKDKKRRLFVPDR